MSSIDDRIVNMHFDNVKFEKGVAESINSIENLKVSLKNIDGTSISFDKLQNAANGLKLDNIAAHAETIAGKFDAMGVIGTTALAKLTSGAIDFVTNGLRKAASTAGELWNTIAGGGMERAQNIEKAKFTIEGLKGDYEALQESINKAVEDTAYGFDEAAVAASQFLATGVKEGDDMTRALTSISGLAAMTNTSYGEISRIMTTVAGNGRLMAMQLNEIGARGINAAATLRDYFNSSEESMEHWRQVYNETKSKTQEPIGEGVQLTEQNVRDMVSKGVIDFRTFSDAMYEAFGEHAKDAQQTFTGASANVRAALKRIGADFQSVTISSNDYKKTLTESGQVDFTKETFNQINVLNELRNVIKGLHTEIKNSGFVQMFTDIYHAISRGMTYFLHGFMDPLDASSKTLAPQLRQAMQNIKDSVENVTNFIIGIASSVSQAWRAVFPQSLNDTILNITMGIKKLTSILPQIGDMKGSLSGIFFGTQEAAHGFGTLKTIFSGLFSVLDMGRKAILGAFEIIERFATPVILRIGEVLGEAILTVTSWVSVLDGAIPTHDSFNGALDVMASFLEPLWRLFDKATNGLKGFLKELRKGGDPLGYITNGFAKFTEKFLGVRIDLKKAFAPVLDFLKPFTDTIKKYLSQITSTVSGFISELTERVQDGESVYAVIRDKLEPVLEYVTPFGVSLKDTFANISEGVKSFLRSLSRGVSSFGDPFANLKSHLTSIKNFMGNALSTFRNSALSEGITSLFDFVKELIRTGIEGIATLIGTAASSIFKALQSVFDNMVHVTDSAADIGGEDGAFGTGNLTKSLADSANKMAGPIADITGLISKLADILRNDAPIIWGYIAVISMALSSWNISMAIRNVTAPLGELAKIPGEMSKSIKKISDSIVSLTNELQVSIKAMRKAVDFRIVADGIKQIAISIAILAAALLMLGSVDTKVLVQGGIALTAIAAGLLALMYAFKKLDGSVNVGKSFKIAASVFGIALSLMLMVAAMRSISKFVDSLYVDGALNYEKLLVVAGIFIVLSGVMTGIQYALSRLEKSTLRSAMSMVLVSAGLLLMTRAMRNLSVLSWTDLAKGVTGIIGMVGILLGLLYILSEFEKAGRKIHPERTSGMLIAFSASMYIMVKAISKLSEISWEGVGKSLVSFGSILAMFLGVIGVLSILEKKISGLKMASISASMIGLALSMIVISGAMWILATIPADSFGQALAGVMALMLGMAALSKIVSSVGKLALPSAGILMMAIAIGILTASLVAIAYIPNLDTAVDTISMLMLGLMALGLVASQMSAKMLVAGGGLLMAAGAIAVLAISLKLISSIQNLESSVDTISMLMLGLMALGLVASQMSAKMLVAGGGLLMMAGAIAILGFTLSMLSGLDTGSMLMAALAIGLLSAVLMALAVVCEDFIVGGIIAIGVLLAFSVAMIAFGIGAILFASAIAITVGALSMLIGIAQNTEAIYGLVNAITIVAQQSGAIIILGIAILVLGVGAAIAGVGIMALGLGLVVLAAGAALGAMALNLVVDALMKLAMFAASGALQTIADNFGALAGLSGILALLGVALIVFGAGAVIAGAGLLVLGAGAAVAAAGVMALGFAIMIAATMVSAAASMFAAAGQNLMEGLAQGIANGIGAVASAIGSVANGVVDFFKGLMGINSPSTKFMGFGGDIMTGLTQGITQGANGPTSAIQGVGGDMLGKFTSLIPGFGDAGKQAGENYSENLKNGVEPGTQEAMGDAHDEMVTTASSAGTESGQAAASGWNMGMGDMDAYTQEMLEKVNANFQNGGFDLQNTAATVGGDVGKSYSESTGQAIAENSSTAEEAVAAVDAIADAAQAEVDARFPQIGQSAMDQMRQGFETADLGSTFVQAMQTSLESAYQMGYDFANTVKWGMESVSLGESATMKVNELVNAFTSSLKVGFNLGLNFSNTVKWGMESVDFTISGSMAGLKYIGGIQSALQGGFAIGMNFANTVKWGAESVDMSSSGNALGRQFISGISGFIGQAFTIGWDLGNTAKWGAESVDMNVSGSQNANEFCSGIAQVLGQAFSSGWDLANTSKWGAEEVDMRISGSQNAAEFCQGISSMIGAAFSAGSGLGYSAVDGARSSSGGMYEIGSNIGLGFVNGIQSKIYAAAAAGAALGNAAKNAASAAVQTASPSKVFLRIGQYVGMGFVIGITDYLGAAGDAGGAMGDAAIDAVNETIEKMMDILGSDLDAAPTIRPVLDDSEIQKGLRDLDNTMSNYGMGGQYAMGLASSLSGMSSFNSGYSESGLAKAIAEELAKSSISGGDVYASFNAYGVNDPNQFSRDAMHKVSQLQRAR